MNDLHTKVEGFGLTLEGRALSWFQTLDPSEYLSFEALEKDFIVAAFSKTGLKHDVLSQIHGFKQESNEFVRDCANRLRHYLARCPEKEAPSQIRLVSIFLEGLSDKSLHAALYMKHHKNLNQCINDAIDYDDNCDRKTKRDDSSSRASGSSKSTTSQMDELIKGVTDKMQQLYGPPRALEQRRVDRPYICGICAGNHPTS